jgi:hypothetical protein
MDSGLLNSATRNSQSLRWFWISTQASRVQLTSFSTRPVALLTVVKEGKPASVPLSRATALQSARKFTLPPSC